MVWRLISSLLVALALFLSPLAMANGSAPAHGSMVAAGDMAAHCAESDQQGEHKGAPDAQVHCMAVCAAVHPAPAAVAGHGPSPRAALAMPTILMLVGIAPEYDTPPPRSFAKL